MRSHVRRRRNPRDIWVAPRAANPFGEGCMILDVSTVLNCSAAKAWDQVQKSSILVYVIWPMARVVPTGAPCPERWSEGLTMAASPGWFGHGPIGSTVIAKSDGVRLQRHCDSLPEFKHELVHRSSARRLDREVTRILRMAPKIPLGD